MDELDRIKRHAGLNESAIDSLGGLASARQYAQLKSEVDKLVKLVVSLNLIVPVNLDNNINRKLNAVENQLKSMGYNPRDNG